MPKVWVISRHSGSLHFGPPYLHKRTSIAVKPQRLDCVAGHVGLEVRRETGKE